MTGPKSDLRVEMVGDRALPLSAIGGTYRETREPLDATA
jgi:hypothetical protein